eukprot:11798757-Karenia_brevis.AAC.1
MVPNMAPETHPKPIPRRKKSMKMDVKIEKEFGCNLNGLVVGHKANMASKMPPTWGRGGARLQVFGLGRLKGASWGLLKPKKASRNNFKRF